MEASGTTLTAEFVPNFADLSLRTTSSPQSPSFFWRRVARLRVHCCEPYLLLAIAILRVVENPSPQAVIGQRARKRAITLFSAECATSDETRSAGV